ncbi:MAG: metal-dependent hydrolase [Oscillospiraceae bacterium]|nr:metal-dependent hydrolase [Oscillospiraceae bacterium]
MAVGVAATLAVTHPNTITSILMAVSMGAVGALISDLDVDSSIANKKANQIFPLLLVIVVLAVIIDLVFQVGLWQKIWNNSNLLKILGGTAAFVSICLFGKNQPHRSFMHSFLALATLDISLSLIYLPLVQYFTVGFLSHLAIDLLNKKKLKLLYPKKDGFSLKLCSSSGIVNRILFVTCSILSGLEVILFLVLSIRK